MTMVQIIVGKPDQLEHIGRQHMHRFDRVFTCNSLPMKPRLLVCNTDQSNRPGEHWIAIYVDDDGRYGEYFDPLGRAPTHIFECR